MAATSHFTLRLRPHFSSSVQVDLRAQRTINYIFCPWHRGDHEASQPLSLHRNNPPLPKAPCSPSPSPSFSLTSLELPLLHNLAAGFPDSANVASSVPEEEMWALVAIVTRVSLCEKAPFLASRPAQVVPSLQLPDYTMRYHFTESKEHSK